MNRIIKVLISLSLALALPARVSAGATTYLCEIKQIVELTAEGHLTEHNGMWEDFVGKTFTVNRKTGEMIGSPFNTKVWLGGVKILNPGSAANSYQALALSGGPNITAMYIYIKEYQEGSSKPFWGNGDYSVIFSGTCE